MQPERRLEFGLGDENGPAENGPDDQDDDVGRKVVGGVMVQLGAAFAAPVGDLEEAREQAAAAARRLLRRYQG